jgi:type IV secretory pathway VirB2 component (pilin)
VHHLHTFRSDMPQPHVLPKCLLLLLLIATLLAAPDAALAQTSPFMTGATSLQTNLLAWLTPVAIILVMVLGGMAMANRMSWGWCIGAIFGHCPGVEHLWP